MEFGSHVLEQTKSCINLNKLESFLKVKEEPGNPDTCTHETAGFSTQGLDAFIVLKFISFS